ncbi:MAG: helix-turn-helix transcriptional regulator [Longimicrobiales bacterium]
MRFVSSPITLINSSRSVARAAASRTINAIETGRYDPSLPLALRIARLFQKPVEALFELDEEPPR